MQPVTQVLAWSNTILDALDYLHSQQPSIIHRDLKPANLRLTDDGKLYLVDFGLAKVGGIENSTLPPAGGLTHGFALLEQYGGRTGPRSDIYALGATLYYLLTAQVPLSAILRGNGDQMIPLQTLNPSVPTNIAAWINKAMALRRDKRWISADAMRQTMPTYVRHRSAVLAAPTQNRVQTGVLLSPLKQAPPRQGKEKKKRSRALPAALAVIALLLLLVIVGGGTWLLTGGSEAGTTAGIATTEIFQEVEAIAAPEGADPTEGAAVTEDVAAAEGTAPAEGAAEGEAESGSDSSAASESIIVPTPTQEPTHTVPAGAPTSTRRPTYTPPPIETPVPPTATAPLATIAIPTVARLPTVRISPTIAIPTVAPQPTATTARSPATNTLVPAPESYSQGPNALEPAEGATINSENVTFKWIWNGPALAGGQQFRVMGFRDGEWLNLTTTAATQSEVWMPGFGNFETAWQWYVVVIDSAGNEISPTSAKLNFGVSLSGGGDDGGGDDGEGE